MLEELGIPNPRACTILVDSPGVAVSLDGVAVSLDGVAVSLDGVAVSLDRMARSVFSGILRIVRGVPAG
jgi:hypothetical protein